MLLTLIIQIRRVFLMATLKKKNKNFAVIYRYVDSENKTKQKWESYDLQKEAVQRQKFIEYYQSVHGSVLVPPENDAVMSPDEISETNRITFKEFLACYVEIYGRVTWSVNTLRNKEMLINKYITPYIGDVLLTDIKPRMLSEYYNQLLTVEEAAGNRPARGKLLQPANVKKIHDIIRSALKQAIAWEYLPMTSTNPAKSAVLPKIPKYTRTVWEIETFKKALEVVEDDLLEICMHVAFSCSLRIGEILGLTWDNLFIDEVTVAENRARLVVEKQLSRVSKEAIDRLQEKDIVKIFPTLPTNTTRVVLMTPKTESGYRTVWIPKVVVNMILQHKKKQENLKRILGSEYHDFNLVFCLEDGRPCENTVIGNRLKKLCKKHNLPKIEFHSLRHLSTSYKLKMTNGDIKSVQGDTGHSKADMVTDVYSHILDEDRRFNAVKLNDEFYGEKPKNNIEVLGEEEQELLKVVQALPKSIRENLLLLGK